MSILGPSGCGKSSTLRMLAGLEHISAGDIRFGGRRINDLPPKDRDIAMVFENYALYPHKTVRENIANPLRLRGTDARTIEAKVREAAACSRSSSCSTAGRPSCRRAEAARGDRPDHRARAAALPVRRADRPSRRQAARPHARRAEADAAAARHDHDLRHARPARGHVDGRPHRRHACGRAAAVRHAPGDLQPPGQRVGRGLRRRAADEHHRRDRGRAGRPPGARASGLRRGLHRCPAGPAARAAAPADVRMGIRPDQIAIAPDQAEGVPPR